MVQFASDRVHEGDLPLSIVGTSDPPPSLGVRGCGQWQLRQVARHRGIELLRQRMQMTERRDGFDDMAREQPHQCRHDACELRIAGSEVVRTVQLVEKEPRRLAVAGLREQVGVGLLEPAVLIILQRVNALRQRGLLAASPALGRDFLKMANDFLSDGIHGRR